MIYKITKNSSFNYSDNMVSYVSGKKNTDVLFIDKKWQSVKIYSIESSKDKCNGLIVYLPNPMIGGYYVYIDTNLNKHIRKTLSSICKLANLSSSKLKLAIEYFKN